jgi:transposase
MKEAVFLKGYTNAQGQNWWRQYRSEGLDGFLGTKGRGRKSPLEGKGELAGRLAKEGFSTINEAREWILGTYGIRYTEKNMGRN